MHTPTLTYRPLVPPREIPRRCAGHDGSGSPHTSCVRYHYPCGPVATNPCRPTACIERTVPVPSPSTDHCSLITVHSSYTFSAKEKDVETGLSYFGSRYYSSDLSIWLSVDPMSDKYASLSPYVYCANNPVKLVDPNGDTIRFETEADKRFVQLLLNEKSNSYSHEFEAIYNILNESEHVYTYSQTHDNRTNEGCFENIDAHCSTIHYSINTYDEHYGASEYRNLFEETYHAFQYDKMGKVINSCFSEAMAWKFSSIAPGTTYVNSKLGNTVMARCRDLPAWQLAFELKFGMLPNESYCGTENVWGKGRYHDFPLAAPEEKIFFPSPVLFLIK